MARSPHVLASLGAPRGKPSDAALKPHVPSVLPAKAQAWLESRSDREVRLVSLCVTLLLGLVDLITGPQIAFSIFYLLPVSITAWQVGTAAALRLSAVAAFVWLWAELAGGADYDHPVIPLWNGVTRFGVFVLVALLLSRLHEVAKEYGRLATTDFLTGVTNARAFEQSAKEVIADCGRKKEPFTVAYIDLDDFKSINDTLGHSTGDKVLRAVASSLASNTRHSDVVARLGGDEFAILLPGLGSDRARDLMTLLVPRVSATVEDVAVSITFSAGAVTYLSAPSNIDEMIALSDRLMYKAKHAQKGSFRHETFGLGNPDAVADRTSPRPSKATTRSSHALIG